MVVTTAMRFGLGSAGPPPHDENPAAVHLPAGTYLIRAESQRQKTVEFFSTIDVGQTTRVYVEELLGETEEKWRESVRRVIELGPDSVTIYQTEIPHNTQLYRDLEAGDLPAGIAAQEPATGIVGEHGDETVRVL